MRKKDVYVILLGLLLAFAAWFWMNLSNEEHMEGEVVIYKDGKEFMSVSLNSEETIRVEDETGKRNVVSIHEGSASVIEANCRDQICVHTRSARNNGESVVCLPNKVVVVVRSKTESVVDEVSE